MKNRVLRQAFGLEPEPWWMSALGAACALLLPAVVVVTYIACGGHP
jgi:hypothetical protein